MQERSADEGAVAVPGSGEDVRAGQAVVVGGSLGGLLAARVLAEHAERVVVVERDRLPEGPEDRAGVPHGRHVHVLLEGGQRALERLLPGVLDELRRLGAPSVGQPEEQVQWQEGKWYRRTPTDHSFLSGTRAQLEWVVRRRVSAHPRIEIMDGTRVTGLLGDAERVRGVLLRDRGARTDAGDRPLEADLVVDASGRGSHAAAWLSAIGAQPPGEEIVDTGLAYGTRIYRVDEEHAAELAASRTFCYYLVPNPSLTYSAAVVPLEDGRYLATLSGLRGQEPPTDPEEFQAYAERLPHPVVAEWMRRAEPASHVFSFRDTRDIRRRYDRHPAPEGFLATGDALCAFNPIYGQGMSVAALNALALDEALAARPRPGTRAMQRRLLRSSRRAWDISTGADRRMPGAQGNSRAPRGAGLATRYLARVLTRAPGDPVVGAAFRSVQHLTAGQSVLFRPAVLRAVLFGRPRPAPAGPPPAPEQQRS